MLMIYGRESLSSSVEKWDNFCDRTSVDVNLALSSIDLNFQNSTLKIFTFS